MSKSLLKDLASSLENTARRDVRMRNSLTIGSAKILRASSFTPTVEQSSNVEGSSLRYSTTLFIMP